MKEAHTATERTEGGGVENPLPEISTKNELFISFLYLDVNSKLLSAFRGSPSSHVYVCVHTHTCLLLQKGTEEKMKNNNNK